MIRGPLLAVHAPSPHLAPPDPHRRGSAYLVVLGAIVAVCSASVEARQTELVERTLAIVGGAVVTQSDVRTAQALALVEGPPDDDAATLARFIERWLVLHEVARFAPPEPSDTAVEAGLAAIRARAGSPDSLAAILARGGYSEHQLRSWVRDDLRIAAYLDQRFAAAGAPTDADVAGYVRAPPEEVAAAGVSAEQSARAARARLVDERRRELVADWLLDLRRRTAVVVVGGP
jgi:hypothetical protein